MKKFLIALLIELIAIAIASIFLFFVWNHMAENYFHWKDLEFVQAAMMTSSFRLLTIKLN